MTRHYAKAKRLPLPIGNSDWVSVKDGYWSSKGSTLEKISKEGDENV